MLMIFVFYHVPVLGFRNCKTFCSAYGQKWDIRFNPVKSQLMTFGGSNPDNTTVYLDRKVVQWCTKMKYLRLYLIGGADFKSDLTAAKRNIMDVLIPLCLLLEIKLTKLWLCILLNHIACHSSCMDVKFGY